MEEEKRDELEEKQEKAEEKQERKQKVVERKKHGYEKGELLETVRGNPWIISTVVLGAIVLVMLVSNFGILTGGFITGGAIGANDAGEKLLNFYESTGVEGLSLDSVEQESGLYKVNFNYQGNPISMYLTKDGKLAGSLSPIDFEVSEPEAENIPKSDKPKVELYVMSFCPYGNLAEETFLPVYNLLKDKVEWNIHYIVSVSENSVSSLHGQPEVDQNIREVCVLNKYGMDSFWKFVDYVNQNCGSDGNCWQDAAKQAGLNVNDIQSCFDSEGLNLMKQEADASNEAGASGSPTMIINGVETRAVYSYGDSEIYKQTICSAFNDEPEECSVQLTSTQSAASGSC